MIQLTYASAGIRMNALLRVGFSQITHLYARFGDSGANPGYLAPADNDIAATVRGDFLASSDGIRGGLWVPLLSVPAQDTSDSSKYVGNQATFSFRIPGNIPTTQVSPANNFDPATSYIYALGLAVAQSKVDRTQDLIFAVLQDFTPFPVPANGQESVDLPLVITI